MSCFYKSLPIILFLAPLFFTGCSSNNYNMEDFYKVKKIDAHIHLNSASNAWIEIAKKDNFKLLSINVDYSDFNPLNEQLAIAVRHRKENPDVFAFAQTFEMDGWGEKDWLNKTISHIDSGMAAGACAVKFWKNIGMEFRDKDSNLVMIDDSSFVPVFDYLKKNNVPVIGHFGEPKDCWQPVDKMLINDMKLYFGAHPHYHMYLHPDMPSYEEQMEARDRMLENNKDMDFMGAHIASLEWSLERLVQLFDKFPNARADLSARMSYMQLHAANDYNKTRDFFIKYQDRLIYATDNVEETKSDDKVFSQGMHDKWLSDWKFLTTDSEMKSNDFNKDFKGLALPKEVIDKIYRINAERLFVNAWEK